MRARDEVAADAAGRFRAWVTRRAAREPAQYILGRQEFHGLDFAVDRRVLIPRPETELLVDLALEHALPGARILDAGTGSGAIAVVLAAKREDLSVVALDRSADALAVARGNAARAGVEERIVWVGVDWRAYRPEAPLDWVISNPPYVTAGDWAELDAEVRDHEPREALVPGPDGLEAYRTLVPLAAEWLGTGGALALEVGFGQGEQVEAIVAAAGFTTEESVRDARDVRRVVRGRRSR